MENFYSLVLSRRCGKPRLAFLLFLRSRVVAGLITAEEAIALHNAIYQEENTIFEITEE